jgi:transcriptional regulator with XRE-family HTH domain
VIDARGRWTSPGRRALLRVLSEMTATAVAARCGVRKTAISALATGANRFPSLPLALALARVVGIDPSTWLDASDAVRSMSTPVDLGPVTTRRDEPPTRAA